MRLSVLLNDIYLIIEHLSVAVRSRVESLSSCHFCSSFLIPFSGRCWCTSSCSFLFVLRSPGDSLMDFSLPGCESLLLLHTDKIFLFLFNSENSLNSACQSNIHSSGAWSSSALMKEGRWEETLVVEVTPSVKRVAFRLNQSFSFLLLRIVISSSTNQTKASLSHT